MGVRGWGLGIAGFLLIASLGAAWKLWRGQLGGLSLPEEIAAAKREGIPLEPRDLAEPEIPPAENAAGPYLQAAADTRAIMKGGWTKQFNLLFPSKVDRSMETLTAAERKTLWGLLTIHAPSIALVREAGRRPRMVIHRSWSAGMVFEDVPGIRDLIQILTIRADLRDVEGDLPNALADLEVAARASALRQSAKSAMEGLNRVETEELVLEVLGRIARRHPHDPQMSVRIRHLVSLLGPSPHLRPLLSDMLFSGREMLAYFAAGGDNCMPGSPWLRLASVRNANEAYLISYWRSVFRRLPQDPLAFDVTRRELEKVFEEYDETDTLRTQGIYLFPVGGLVDRLAEMEARRRVALTSADVLERWQREGHLPDAPPVPREDPFGTELRYVRRGSELAIYSLNLDRQDDRGRSFEKEHRETTDIAWHFNLPSPATIGLVKR